MTRRNNVHALDTSFQKQTVNSEHVHAEAALLMG